MVNIYIACHDQLKPEDGAFDSYISSHFPLTQAKQHKKYCEVLDEEFKWFQKYQLLLGQGEGLIFLGNVFHSIHGNKSNKPRVSLYYVVKIDNDEIPGFDVDEDLDEVGLNWEKYKWNETEWIMNRTDFMTWYHKDNTQQVASINWSKDCFSFKEDTVFD